MIELFEQRLILPNKLFHSVESPLEIADIKGKSVPRNSVAYVVLMDEKPTSNQQDSASVVQTIRCTIGIIMGISSVNDKGGKKGNAKIQKMRKDVKQRLIGWLPTGASAAVEYAGGSLLAMADNGLWWTDKFTVTYLIEAPIEGG